MKILVIGASGRLGSEVVRQLDELNTGDTYRLGDVVAPSYPTKHEFVKCDVIDPDSLIPAIEGMDLIYSAHVGHPKARSDSPAGQLRFHAERFDVLVRGTFDIMQGAALLGVKKVVQVTSEAARGQRLPLTATEVCDENTPAKPDYVYALSKYIKEVIAEYMSRIEGVQTYCLRNGWFQNPGQIRDLNSLGSSLLYQGSVTRYDMARASVLAIQAMKTNDVPNNHEVFLLNNSTEITRAEVPELRTNPEAVFERHYPGILALYKQYEIDFEGPKQRQKFWKIDDISKAKRMLGWEPTYTLRDFYNNLKAGKYTKGRNCSDLQSRVAKTG
jgi:nucleoside-diphosphate-sugar epimerase